MADLLPPNATPLERNLAHVGALIERVPVPLRDLVNPDTCPVSALPFLAWHFSVDRWDAAWSVEVKRAVIRSAWFVHQKKGTIGALRRVVEPLGFLIRVIEWWQTEPAGPRGTFKLDIGVLDFGITEAMYQELERLIDDAKPLTRHLTGMAISMEVRGNVRTGVCAYLGDELTVHPYSPEAIAVTGRYGFAAIAHTIDTMRIQPFTA